MPKESLEFSRSAEGTIEFDGETCCALERGFEQNPELVKELENIVEANKIKLFKDILFNSLDPKNRAPMRFVPAKEEIRIVYSQIAKRELERIKAEDEDDGDLNCGYTVDEHREALELVVEKMKTSVN